MNKQPSVLLPDIARNKLKAEAELIKKAYKQPLLRQQAIDHLVDKMRAEYPHAFTRFK